MSTKYEIIEVNKVTVSVDVSMLIKTDDLFFNATEIAKQFDKKPADWLRSESAQKYIKIVSDVRKIHIENLIKTKRGGKYQGTWLDKELALPFARWCIFEFEYRLDKWIIERLNQEHEWKQKRIAAKTGYLPMTDAVENAHDPAKFYHYTNEADLINRIVLGMSSKKFKKLNNVDDVRDALDALQLKQIENLQLVNTGLIKIGMDFETRKHHLKTLHEKDTLLISNDTPKILQHFGE